MFDVKRFIESLQKYLPYIDIANLLGKLSDNPTLKIIAENNGSIGNLIQLLMTITKEIYDSKVSPDKRLSIILMRIMLESAKDSLPFIASNTKIKDFINNNENEFVKNFENIVLDLFDSKYYDNSDGNNKESCTKISTIPDHPVFINFKDLLVKGIIEINKKHEYGIISIPRFLTEFNSNVIIKLEDETKDNKNNQDLKNLLHKWQVNKDFEKLLVYLKNARNVYFEKNLVDKKSLSDYYVENKTYKVAKDTWGTGEKYINDKEEWDINSFLKDTNNFIEVIAAPFGIGKSSLARKMSFDMANKFIENPVDPNAYLPVFVQLKFALKRTCNGNKSLENDLLGIAGSNIRKNEANILIILDGLDELSSDNAVNNLTIYKTIQQEFLKNYPNSKYIITTRLESDFPKNLEITDHYIRLFSFNEDQIKQFFSNYGLTGITSISNVSNSIYENISNILSKKNFGKPLFCWMLATVYNNSSDSERKVLFGYPKNHSLAEVLLYQRFIHDVILGKPREIAKKDYEEWFKKSKDEKKALRLLAFLKLDRPSLSKNKIENFLDPFEYALPTTSKSLLSTYFSFSKTNSSSEEIEFAHKSFQEYLLAEFYLESIFNEKFHRLIGHEPTSETYSHLLNMINLLASDDKGIEKYAKDFIKTFYEEDDYSDGNLKNYVKTIANNSLKYIKQKDLLPILPSKEDLNIWNIPRFGYCDLDKLWFSRWICILIAGNPLINKGHVGEEFLKSSSFFIKNANRLISEKILWFTDLNKIDLSYADLTGADLTGADLTGADLSHAILTSANLKNANLSGAKLFGADLSVANLYTANLSSADLTRANLSSVYLYGANLDESILIDIKNYHNLKTNEIRFKRTLTNSSGFLNHIREYNYLITVKQMDKIELEEVIKEMRLEEKAKEYIQGLKIPLFLISN